MNPAEEKVRLLISKAVTKSKKGWKTVAEELSTAVDATITESMLHEFTRSRRTDKNTKKLFPMEWVSALARITRSHELEQFALCEECQRALTVGKVGTKAIDRMLR